MRPVLLTGFEPYAGRGSNPAFDTMRALDGKKIRDVEIVGRALPVSISSIRTNAQRLVEEIEPSAIVSVGLWPGESMIRLERVALNVADFEIGDNEGAIWHDQKISGNGPEARPATLPLRKIEDGLLEAGIPVRISSTAGTYLCNACLYSFLEEVEQQAYPLLCGFIHVPYTPEQVAAVIADLRKGQQLEQHQRADLVSMELSRTIRAVEIAIDTTIKSLQ
jgi:pyroglutamyl-peptidase